MKGRCVSFLIMTAAFLAASQTYAQSVQADSTRKVYKNIIRYNLSGALIFGADKYIVLGYERVLSPRKSVSVNFGRAAMPKLTSIVTDSFQTQKEGERTGYNMSIDYRFFLAKENKFDAPHGLYIGPYYSYNHFTRDNQWLFNKSTGSSFINTHTTLNINTIGFQFGYQFILWKRLALDFCLVGPGFGIYNYKASFDGNVTAENKEQLFEGLKQLLTQKFPGMNFVFADKEINANGTMNTNTLGYRYIFHVGYAF